MCFLEQLEDEEVQTRVAGCAALGCLKVRDVRRRQQGCMFQRKRKRVGGDSGHACTASCSSEQKSSGCPKCAACTCNNRQGQRKKENEEEKIENKGLHTVLPSSSVFLLQP